MKNKEIQKNLKHGYIFLTTIILVIFVSFLCAEIYLKGGFRFKNNSDVKTDNEEQINQDNSDVLLEFQNITDGYKTKDTAITVVAKTNVGNKAWINDKETTVNETGVFELKIDLVTGSNEIRIEAQKPDSKKTSKKLSVIREEEPKPTDKPTVPPKEQPPIQSKPNITKPEPTTTKAPTPQQPSITGLKLHCSITNTQPTTGQTVTLSCTVKDQDDNPVNGATGNAILSWQSGALTYNFPSSNSGITQVSFPVPAGNKGTINGTVRITKDGLTVTSNFSINVQ